MEAAGIARFLSKTPQNNNKNLARLQGYMSREEVHRIFRLLRQTVKSNNPINKPGLQITNREM